METIKQVTIVDVLKEIGKPVPKNETDYHDFQKYTYIGWQSCVRLMNARTLPLGATWRYEYDYLNLDLKDPQAECAIKCVVTVTAPDGTFHQVSSIGWDKSNKKNGPSVHLAERRAFKRALTMLGISYDGEGRDEDQHDSGYNQPDRKEEEEKKRRKRRENNAVAALKDAKAELEKDNLAKAQEFVAEAYDICGEESTTIAELCQKATAAINKRMDELEAEVNQFMDDNEVAESKEETDEEDEDEDPFK